LAQRLIDWNSEILMQLLKQVVARRFAVPGRRTQQDALWEMARNVGDGHMPVEEVAEIIQLPDFDERAIRQVDPDTVILSPEVTAQCRSYVALLASMYRDNPFHNFEVCFFLLIISCWWCGAFCRSSLHRHYLYSL
jgi:hypothetical protein